MTTAVGQRARLLVRCAQVSRIIIGAGLRRTKDLARKVLPPSIWSLLRFLWACYSFAVFRPRIVSHRYGDQRLELEIIDFDGAQWYDRDIENFPEIALLAQHGLSSGARVFVAGANQCLQAMLMAKTVTPGGSIWAIEPNRRNANAGRRNLDLNGITNCTVLDGAVANYDGRIMVNQSMNGQISIDRWRIGALEVDAFTIDSLIRRLGPPEVLYIDVEGFECAALDGAKQTIRDHTPDCFVEVHTGIGLEKFGGTVDDIILAFANSTYELRVSDGQDGAFRELKPGEKPPRSRFFLVALARNRRRAECVGPRHNAYSQH
jgi:FkbM family methyltransferase